MIAKKLPYLLLLVLMAPMLMGAKTSSGCGGEASQEQKDHKAVAQQQSQYAKRQPVPAFDWSLERELVIQLYHLRNSKVATHSVWRSDYGTIEGDCPSMGYGVPYDTSLTNPWQLESGRYTGEAVAVGQAEPNGIFASTNTAATWVICTGKSGRLEPVYVETKVTTYPGHMHVDYEANRVTRGTGKHTSIKLSK